MKIIEITVEGGVIQHIDNIPEGIEVHVRDFDVDDDTHPEVEFNDNKEPYYLGIWKAEHQISEQDLP